MNGDFTLNNSSPKRLAVFTFKEATVDGFTPSSIPCIGIWNVMMRISREGMVKQENSSDKKRRIHTNCTLKITNQTIHAIVICLLAFLTPSQI